MKTTTTKAKKVVINIYRGCEENAKKNKRRFGGSSSDDEKMVLFFVQFGGRGVTLRCRRLGAAVQGAEVLLRRRMRHILQKEKVETKTGRRRRSESDG